MNLFYCCLGQIIISTGRDAIAVASLQSGTVLPLKLLAELEWFFIRISVVEGHFQNETSTYKTLQFNKEKHDGFAQ